jgi:hypothetical protein
MEDQFTENLLRALLAHAMLANAMTAAREVFGKSYFSLGLPERAAVDQMVRGFVGSDYHAITPGYLAEQQPHPPMGFGISRSEAPTKTPE